MRLNTVEKNLILEKKILEKAEKVLLDNHSNLTEAVTLFLKAIVKAPSLLETVEKTANMRTGSFIGMLDGKVGKESYKTMKHTTLEKNRRV